MASVAHNNRRRGFTLVELLIAIAIMGILMAIALPVYRNHLQRGYRAEARAGLLQAQQWLERAATATGEYPRTDAFPAELTKIPSDSYDIAVQSEDGATFILTATPKGNQSGDPCGSYTLTYNGVRGLGNDATLSISECWGK
jgi:type IV pilus assembly protein PilE